ncbi:hypothetical protein QWY31_02060 [Cytophagales bacterium LB-30]|uniref:Uncharacterized protein n=1 Tax=Shiella aurantiaca TaxID=3058365 RepID=A0ABT8F1U2_9BACT|nr:hypothetical protein [Shiella aurantiaca]MDN4164264.1 hypothetical protein [Shiella aurantiaca]
MIKLIFLSFYLLVTAPEKEGITKANSCNKSIEVTETINSSDNLENGSISFSVVSDESYIYQLYNVEAGKKTLLKELKASKGGTHTFGQLKGESLYRISIIFSNAAQDCQQLDTQIIAIY